MVSRSALLILDFTQRISALLIPHLLLNTPTPGLLDMLLSHLESHLA